MSDDALQLDIWTDYVCPFCYLQLPVIDRLARELDGRVSIRWHAFELHPAHMAAPDPDSLHLRLTWARSVFPLARRRNLVMHVPPVMPRTRLASEAAAFAASEGHFSAFQHALFRSYFEQGLDIGQDSVLLRIADQVGLDTPDMAQALREHSFERHVIKDEAQAEHIGLRGVPSVIVRRPGESLSEGRQVQGSLSYEQLVQKLEAAWTH